MDTSPTVEVEPVDDGFVYVVTQGEQVTRSRLWPSEAKAQQAGEDFARFLSTGEAVATPVPGTPSLKTHAEPPAAEEPKA